MTAPVRFVVQLPKWFDKKLKIWAALKGTARATLAANIIQARIEANWEGVLRDIDEIANSEGKTRDEIIEAWISESDE